MLDVMMLTYNSEETITKSLNSLMNVKPYVVNLNIIDTGSTDNTQKIVKHYNYYYHINWINTHFTNFADLRNLGIRYCKGPVCLILDSDESFDTNMLWELKNLGQSNKLAFAFPRIRLFPDREHFLYKQYPDAQMRLFKVLPEMKFVNPIHEVLTYKGKQVKPEFTKKVNFYHWDLLQSKERLIEKGKRWQQFGEKHHGSYLFKSHEHPYMKIKDFSFPIQVPEVIATEQYDDLQGRVNTDEEFKRRLKEVLELIKGEKVIDIGTSTGEFALALQDTHQVWALDFDERAINICKNRSDKVKWFVGDAENIDFPDKYFDTALVCEVLEHTHDPSKIIKETARISKHAIFTVPNLDSEVEKRCASPHHHIFFDSKLLEKELKPYFKSVKITGHKLAGLTAVGDN